MPCGHWLGERGVRAIARRTGLPVVSARRCTGTLILDDGSQMLYDFARHVVLGPHPEPRNYAEPEKT